MVCRQHWTLTSPFSCVSYRGVRHLARSMDSVSMISVISQVHDFINALFSFSEGQGFILLYSVTSRTSFERLEIFHQHIRRVKREPVFILVGNNCHKAYAREVSKEEGHALARRYGCEFFEASAATAQNVECVFANLIRLLRQARIRNSVDPGAPIQKEKKANCVVM
jgi:GTPase SAR1 family protein